MKTKFFKICGIFLNFFNCFFKFVIFIEVVTFLLNLKTNYTKLWNFLEFVIFFPPGVCEIFLDCKMFIPGHWDSVEWVWSFFSRFLNQIVTVYPFCSKGFKKEATVASITTTHRSTSPRQQETQSHASTLSKLPAYKSDNSEGTKRPGSSSSDMSEDEQVGLVKKSYIGFNNSCRRFSLVIR